MTARMTLRRKNDPTKTSKMQNISASHYGEASDKLYIKVVHPSRVIT